MQQRVYHSREIQAWEQRWFEQQNSSYGLMQQVAWQIAQHLQTLLLQRKIQTIAQFDIFTVVAEKIERKKFESPIETFPQHRKKIRFG